MSVHRRPLLPTGATGSSSGVNVGGNVSSSPEENRDLGDRFEDLLGKDDETGVPESGTERAEAERFSPANLFAQRARDRGTQASALAARQSTDAESAEQQQTNAHERGGGLKRTAAEAREETDRSDRDAAASSKSQDSKVEAKKKQSQDQDSQGGDSDGQSGQQTPDLQIQLPQQSDVSGPADTAAADDSGSERLTTEVAHEVASRIIVERSAAGGSTRVQIDLRDELLPDTRALIEDKDGSLTVTLACGGNDTAAMLKQHTDELEKAISEKTGRSTHVEIEANGDRSSGMSGSPAGGFASS